MRLCHLDRRSSSYVVPICMRLVVRKVNRIFFKLSKNCSFTYITLIKVHICKLKFCFINYELDISSFIAFEAFLQRLKKSLSGG